jgi:hypothetical protein
MPMESPPVSVQALILPRSAGDARVEAFWELLLEAGFSELAPEEIPSSPHLILDSAEYMADVDPSDYVGMRERARVRVRALRERLEGGMLRQWELDDRTLEDSDAWIAVDGQLKDIRAETVDEVSRWILAERAPLAKPDPRWPSMIYPIHYVEKILKPLVQGSERSYSRLERQLTAIGRN